jgi:hypothetical protein
VTTPPEKCTAPGCTEPRVRGKLMVSPFFLDSLTPEARAEFDHGSSLCEEHFIAHTTEMLERYYQLPSA